MDVVHQRVIKVPKGTHLKHLTLRPHAAEGSIKKVTVLKGNQAVGHFVLSDKQKLSDFSFSLHHRHLFLSPKPPTHHVSPNCYGIKVWIMAAPAKMGTRCQTLRWAFSILALLFIICFDVCIKKEPSVAKWAALDALWICSFGVMTWEDWRQMDVFYLLYDWLLVMLQERLLSAQGPNAIPASSAGVQLLWIATLASLLLLTAATKLIWATMLWCITPRHWKHAKPMSARQQQALAQHLLHDDSYVSTATSTQGLHQEGAQSGRQGALLDPPVSLSLKRGIAAGRDVHFMGRLPDIGMASDLRTGFEHDTAAHQLPASSSSSSQPLPQPLHPSEEDSRQAQLAEMRKTLEEAGVETVSRADARSIHLQAENESLRFQVSFLTAQLTAAQQGEMFFRSLVFSESKTRLAAVKRAQVAFQQLATDGQNKTQANASAQQGSVDKQANQTSNKSAAMKASATAGDNASKASSGGHSTGAGNATANARSSTAGINGLTPEANTSTSATKSTTTKAANAAQEHEISARRRVQELSSDLASLRDRWLRTSADLEQAVIIIGKKDAAFVQADKMRKRAEEGLIGVAADRDRLQQIATSLLRDQKADSTQPLASHNGTDDTLPHLDCNQQSPSAMTVPATDQTGIDTPAKRAPHKPTRTVSRQLHASHQTDNHNLQIPAVHAGQELQSEVQGKEVIIHRQAAELTTAAVKMTAQQGLLQQLQSALRGQELAALLFHVRLVPTKGFKGEKYDIPPSAKLLGEGGSATIYQETLFGELRATKYPKKGVVATRALAHELCMHLRCAGPNTVSVLSVGMDRVPTGPVLSSNIICFSMELASMSLKTYIAQATGGFKGSNRNGLVFSLDTTKFLLQQTVAAIQGAHRTNTLHGDIKPDNFLVFLRNNEVETVKITDFGLSTDLVNGSHDITPTADGTRGTPGWTASEMYAQNLPLQQQHKSVVCAKADIYAAGWVFFEVLCGLSPLLFQEAKSDDEFAANARTVAALDSKVMRREISIDTDDSSLDSNDTSDAAFDASCCADEEEDTASCVSSDCTDGSGQVAADTSSGGQSKAVDQVEIVSTERAILDSGSQNKEVEQEANATGSSAHNDSDKPGGNYDLHMAAVESHVTDVADNMDMVHVYPEYLLSGVGLNLLQLCMAMWSPDAGARPTCEDILHNLAAI